MCWHWRMPEICQDLLDISRSNHPKENGGILTNVAVLYLQLFVKPSDGLSDCWSTRKAHSKKDQCFPIKTVPLSRSRFLPKKFHHMKQNCTQKEPKNDHMKAIENKPESPTIFLWPIPVKNPCLVCNYMFIYWVNFLASFQCLKVFSDMSEMSRNKDLHQQSNSVQDQAPGPWYVLFPLLAENWQILNIKCFHLSISSIFCIHSTYFSHVTSLKSFDKITLFICKFLF